VSTISRPTAKTANKTNIIGEPRSSSCSITGEETRSAALPVTGAAIRLAPSARAAGDRLLIVTAERLKRRCPVGAGYIRLGGDKFAILLEGATAKQKKTGQLAQEFA